MCFRGAPGGSQVLGVRDHLLDAVLVDGALDQVDQLLGAQCVELDPPGMQDSDLRLGGVAFAQPIVTDMLEDVLTDRLVLEPAFLLALPRPPRSLICSSRKPMSTLRERPHDRPRIRSGSS